MAGGQDKVKVKTVEGLGNRMKDLEIKLDKVLALVSAIPSLQTDMATIKNDISSLQTEQKDDAERILNNENSLSFLNDELETMKVNVNDAKENSCKALDQIYFIDALKEKTKELNTMLLNLEAYGRRDNLIFEGIPEVKDENCFREVKEMLINTMNIEKEHVAQIRFDRCHRLHTISHKPNAPKPIIVRFNWFQDREYVWGKRFDLKGSGIFIREDFPGIIDSRRRALTPVLNMARKMDWRAAIIGDTLIFKGKRYTWETLPDSLALADCGSKQIGNMYCFSGRSSPFSNFFKSKYEIDGMTFNGGEQYFQYQKAIYANRKDIAARIVLEEEPIIQKRLGDSIVVPKEWIQGPALTAMSRAVEAKFRQNTKLSSLLLKIHRDGKQLVECNPNDNFWGIGLHISKEGDIKDSTKWKGQNMLGRCISELAVQLSKKD